MSLMESLYKGPVIPSVRSIEDFNLALSDTTAPSLFLLFGDINNLPKLLRLAEQHKKRLLVHGDLLEGVGKDKAGIKYLARQGVTALVTTKPHLVKMAREEGLVVIQRLFLIDSEALRTGIKLLREHKPDAVEILPASVPRAAVQEIVRGASLPVFAGGLVTSREDVLQALKAGACAVSTSKRELWNIRV
ncbi:MAG: glycerol-3-phosphate responsive antiterminator [Firmicutes bacterium]|nr:glycerol-3-phosphate responsive antiterminator [Dethiobacter sp.]MBS3887700.1 glycerol-3-phosphate responsive antiterminator [Bacillota bacterium]MBS4053840.1 glycerol-3-phosphate responsive antiterminator [Thermaerobacter sp.]